ncbi:MAG: hypothetical protein QG670_805 [Thermoproteota archaeon]|nr:hypothetical protein [Thermoproteota archaeon]
MASVNNTCDVTFDTVSKIMNNQNPIVTNELTIQEAQSINYITVTLAITTSFFAGFYWIVFTLIGIGLVILYDIKPFRMKDRPSGILITPLHQALPFLFVYINTTASFIFPHSVLLCFMFLFFGAITSLRHIPDFEKDLQMNVHNFASRYSIEAAIDLELVVNIILPVILIIAIILNYISILGLPLLALVTALRVGVLLKPIKDLKTTSPWKKYAQYMAMSNLTLLISAAGIYFV